MKRINLPIKNVQVETVILANGEFPNSELTMSVLKNAKFLVCCDGATNQLLQNSNFRLPDAIVGDCDSISKENVQRFSNIIHSDADQETNDLTKAVKLCCNLGRKNITILGATGKREDHTLANISLLAEYLDIIDFEIRMITDFGVFDPIKKDTEFESFIGQQVSIYNINGANITSENLKYPLKNRVLKQFWEGALNESMSDFFRLKTDNKLIVFRDMSL